MESTFLYSYSHVIPSKPNLNLLLTKKEIAIFNTITSILKKHNHSDTICRVAGGWVRDKLLNKESLDIDIALNNMKGGEIVKIINDELYPGKNKYGIVKSNLEHSKHLETGTIKICDVWIDFVNLRNDNENEIGTPEEDALRRDITINALFYNINENKIEDFTKSGIDDLTNGIIRTPLNPYKTFKDDPLRILRLIRFATKYQFIILDEVVDCIKKNNKEFRELLYTSITNERIKKEICEMMEGNNAHIAVYLLYKFNIMDKIMKLPLGNKELENEELLYREITQSALMALLSNYVINKENSKFQNLFNKYDKKGLYLSIMTFPFSKYTLKINRDLNTISRLIIKDGLKLANEDLRLNTLIIGNINEFINFVHSNSKNKLKIGRLVRKVKYHNLSIMFLLGITNDYYTEIKKLNIPNDKVMESINQNIYELVLNHYIQLYDFIEKEHLAHLDDMKLLLDGEQIIKVLKIKPGKSIGILLDKLLDKQIETPDMSKESAVEFLKKKREEIMNSNNK